MKIESSKIILSAFLFACSIIAANEAEAACTTFVGMSQTRDTCDGMDRIGAENFVCWWKGGQEIDSFANGSAFSGLMQRHNHCNRAHPKDSTRVAIQLSAPTQSRDEVRRLSEQVVDQVRNRFPNVQQIILITSSGGPDGKLCEVRDNMRNHNKCVMYQGTYYVRSSFQYNSQNWQGMNDYASTDSGVSVYASKVCVCGDYSDGKGHLTRSGDLCKGRKWRDNILNTTALPVPDSV